MIYRLTWQYRLFRAVPKNEQDRGLKFIRAAHLWFVLAAAMLVFTPIYNFLVYLPLTGSRVPFSHAFFGAYGHALAVGFVIMMIVGVSSKVVPTLSGVDVRRANALWPTFVLLNLGNVTRVSSQIAADFFPSAYSIMGFSGFVEVLGLTLWGYELVSNLRTGKKPERQPLMSAAGPTEQITPQTVVGDVLASYPESLQIFLKYGFSPLANPILRRTMARVITLEQACRREGANLEKLLTDLNKLAVNQHPVSSVQIVALTRTAPSN
jgi:hypothetical protein